MTKFLLSLTGFGIAIGLGIAVMINGWGLEPISWGWIIQGNIGGALLGAIFQLADQVYNGLSEVALRLFAASKRSELTRFVITLKEINMDFETTDIVMLKANDVFLEVTGVIHDEERLFVTGRDNKEFEVSFSDVGDRWAKREL